VSIARAAAPFFDEFPVVKLKTHGLSTPPILITYIHIYILSYETITHYNTLQHTATHCNTLQYTATHCNPLQHTAAAHCNTPQHTATRCITLHHTAQYCTTLQHTATHCTTLQHTATHCNTLQHTAILYETSSVVMLFFPFYGGYIGLFPKKHWPSHTQETICKFCLSAGVVTQSTHAHAHVYIHMHTCTQTHECVCTACRCACVHVCVCVCMYTCVCAYTTQRLYLCIYQTFWLICTQTSHTHIYEGLTYCIHYQLWHTLPNGCVCVYVSHFGSYLRRRVTRVTHVYESFWIMNTQESTHLCMHQSWLIFTQTSCTHIHEWLVYCSQFEWWIHSKVHVGYHSFGSYLHRRVVFIYMSDSYICVTRILSSIWIMNTQQNTRRISFIWLVFTQTSCTLIYEWLIHIWVILNDEYAGICTSGGFKCWGRE